MSCPAEEQLFLYAESLLEGGELREVESHLVGCRDCRARVVGLHDETRLLSDTLTGRVREAPAPTPAQPVVSAETSAVGWGLPVAIAGAVGIFSVVGFLLESRMPLGLEHLNPMRVKGAFEMSFDLIFLIRNRAPGLLELAVSIGVVASVSALLTLGTNVLYRRVFGTAAVLLAVLLASPPAQAIVYYIDEDVRVSATEVVDESVVATGEIAHIDGTVKGDVIAAVERLTVGGVIEGNLYAFTRDLEITGRVEGSVHGLIEHTRIDGAVTGSLFEVGESITLAPGGSVGRDFSIIAEDGILGGSVGRDVFFGGDVLELRGAIGRDVEVRWAEKIWLRDAARIGGDLAATLREESDLDRAPGSVVAGTLGVLPQETHKERYLDWYKRPRTYVFQLLGLVAAFFFGLLLHTFFPTAFENELRTSGEFFRKLGFGFLGIVVTPIAVLLLGLTLVGIPIAVLGLFLFIVVLYTAVVLVGGWVGARLLPVTDPGLWGFGRSLLVGLLVVTVVTHIPFVGPAVQAIVFLVGTGMQVERLRDAATEML